MTTANSTYVERILKKTELFDDSKLAMIMAYVRSEGCTITEAVVKQTTLREDEFMEGLAPVIGVSFVSLNAKDIESDILALLPTKAVFQYKVVPLEIVNGALLIATSDPFDADLVDAIRLATGMRVKLALSTSEEISQASKGFYGVGAETVDRMIQDDRFEVGDDDPLSKMDISKLNQEASVVKFVNQIIWEAVQQEATDIHLEPMEDALRIRYRIDGVLHETPVPKELVRFQSAITSRIKVMANLDIAEKRLPMDGRIGLRVQGTDIDIRVSTMPTVYGESISLRLLQRKGQFIRLQALGLSDRDSDIIKEVVHRPNGIVLVTGPTGSGKSTSLYAFLSEINNVDRRILTVEEPIEYEIAGVNQVLVRPDIGLTFARSLRAFLRQDPDVIMVGEIRDQETAEIAIQASLTGHLVFSTLHTNDAAGAFTRLLDMGVEPFLVASAVEAVIAQRLVRLLCPHCRQPVETDVRYLESLEFPVQRLEQGNVYAANGCRECRKTGFKGRGGIFELLAVSEEIESMVISRSSSNEIKQQSINEGMLTLRDDGWDKVISKVTTIEEILRVTEENA